MANKTKRRMWKQIRLSRKNCLDVEGGSKKRGARVIAWPCHKGTNQKFRVTRGRLQAKHSRRLIHPTKFIQM